MGMQLLSYVMIAAIVGLFAGFLIGQSSERRGMAVLADAAKEQGRSSAAIEIATLKERGRAYDADLEHGNNEREALSAALESSRSEGAALNERAARVQGLDAQIAKLLDLQQFDQQEILRLSSNVAEKSQAYLDASGRLAEFEKTFADCDHQLDELQRMEAGLREESGRLNAEIKAEREALTDVRDILQQEKILRLSAETQQNKLAGELAESDKQRAVFESDLGRLPLLDEKILEIERLLVTTQKQAADLREISGRVNAELKAERDALAAIHDTLQQEKILRVSADALVSTLASDLALSNMQRAVFEADAGRIPSLDKKILENELLLFEIHKQAADLREISGQANAELKAERDVLATVRAEWQIEKNQREQAEARANKLTTEVAELSGRLESERNQGEEKLALLLEAKESLTNQFKSLANDILEEKSKKFTEQNQTNIGQLLDPLRTKLHEFQGKVEEVYVQEGKDRTALAEQVRQLMDLNQMLSQDAKNLTSALKGSNKIQGNWGELILERVLEASGLRKGHEYDVQASHTREDGTRAQPDVVVHLPEDRHLIVDAKVSLVAYEACMSADDDGERQIAIKRHLDSVRAHMKGLSEKNYQTIYGLKSLDFVLMFIPIEPAFMVAITHDQGLYMEALNKNVLLVSPSTLLFVVRTVAHLWRQEAQSKNAQEIAKRGAELYDRLSAFVADLEKVGDRLRMTQDSYTDARNKLCLNRGNVIRQAEMLKQLGVKPTKSIPAAILDMASADDDSVVDGVAAIEYTSEPLA